MSIENRRFLQEGIKRYEEARNTVSAFEEAMGRFLEEATRNRDSWRPMNKVKIQRNRSYGGRQYGYWIAMDIRGKSPRGETAVIDCGLWWRSEFVDVPIIYANYYKQPKRVASFAWNNKSEIHSFSAWHRTFLYLPLRKVEEIERSLNRLLDALLKQLK